MNVRQRSAVHLRSAQTASHAFSRRQFIQTGGSLAAAVAVGSSVLRSRPAYAAAPDDPLPIPGGSPALGGGFHIYGPTPDGSFDPIDAEPCPVGNVNAAVGLAYIDGTVTRIDMSTGKRDELPFIASDMRFVQGVYRGVDGKPRQGTFGFI
jgi:TAT (twin-arginine translocation) pathway signal sequence